MPRKSALLILIISLNAHAIFWGPRGRCPMLLTSVKSEAIQISAVEPVFFSTLMKIGSDDGLTRWVLAGGSQSLKFKFIFTVLKKITQESGLTGGIDRRELEYFVDDSMNYAATTRSTYMARMVTMKLIGEQLDRTMAVDPTLIYRIGILSGQIRERGPTDPWLSKQLTEERRMMRATPEGSTELYWFRLSLYFYRRILEEIPPQERKRFSRNELLRRVSENNPFGLAVAKTQISRLVRAGALIEKPIVENAHRDRIYGFDSVLSVAVNK